MNNDLEAIMGDRLVTITDVYKATGIARSTLVQLYYRRAKNVNLVTLKTLCDYLGVSLSELIEYNPSTQRLSWH
ncbi:helix-turn-helix transcriptional regulator [Lactobacillus paracasei subsp. paracasei]|uniref:helix-turn-helix domain-containing protein n=1 Tax=Lacticaseibacillus paracasei TaxID=1597 RepID=UPI0018C49DEE|nr:helix-turn-helix transcriptional regulator [Lacticaseibacillus paracasei]MBG1273266.1 helix-turn-helix transcriptional regulator [Lacticaseibacillus paracasei subsp. paracasei]